MAIQRVLMTDSRKEDVFYEEAIKTLRTNMQFSGVETKSIVITSCYPNEGKSDVAFQLGIEIGKMGKKVLVLDADIRKSSYIKRFQIKQKIEGLSQYLSGQVSKEQIIYSTNYRNVDIIFSGPYAPNPSELLEQELFSKLIEEARNAYDYVLIDTAKQYGNEAAVGQGIQDGLIATGRKRNSIFLTTKIFNGDQGDYDKLRQAVKAQLKRLQTDYVDLLLLLHWPVNDKYNESWRALEDIYADGQAKSIGICNFNVERRTDLLDHAKIKPAINQIEFNPLIHQPKIVKFCRENDIQLEAWSPLGNGRLLSNDVIKQIADEHQKSPAQVILRWEIQQDFIVLTKTTHPQRMQENAEIFDFTLSPDEMEQIDKLDQESHSIWYDKFKWSGNPDGVDDYIGKPGAF